MAPSHLALILHAHFPDLRESGGTEERWLFEAVAQSYLPLLEVLERLEQERIPVRVAVSISPTLAAMLDDSALMGRCAQYLQALCDLAAAEVARHHWDVRIQRLAEYWWQRYSQRRVDLERREGRLLPAFARLAEHGRIELLTTAATHGYLPLLAAVPSAAERQVRLGRSTHRHWSGDLPNGFWLPELGWSPALDTFLRSNGVAWTCVDAHAVVFADCRPWAGTFAPIVSPCGIAAFPRDAELSRAVWSAHDGYPGAPWYLDYHRDIGWERTPDELGPLARPGGARGPVGIKYHRVTGPTDEKAIYEPSRAAQLAREHAADFVRRACTRAARAAAALDRAPLLVVAFDAELFGHWWHEGPLWLKHMLRDLAGTPYISAITPSDYLGHTHSLQCAMPAESSWGEGGGHSTWWNPTTSSMWAWLHHAAMRFDLAEQQGRNHLSAARFSEATRHLLQAQASDWMFMLSRCTTPAYARMRWDQAVRGFELAMGCRTSSPPTQGT